METIVEIDVLVVYVNQWYRILEHLLYLITSTLTFVGMGSNVNLPVETGTFHLYNTWLTVDYSQFFLASMKNFFKKSLNSTVIRTVTFFHTICQYHSNEIN